MGNIFTPGLQVSENLEVTKTRELPIEGELLVSEGDFVSADTLVAQAELPGELQILRISEKLSLEAFEVKKGLIVKEGDLIKKGQLICQHAGLFGLLKVREFSPCDGVVEFISDKTAHVGVRMASKAISLDAYIAGEVISCEMNRSVRIKANAALIQGIFGVGGERKGELLPLDISNEQELQSSDLPQDCSELVLAGGTNPSGEVIQLASERGATGLVVGSVDDKALKMFLGYDLGIALTGDEDISMTLIVTEGFGNIPFANRSMELLRRFKGKPVSINGATQVRAGAVRPEIIICHEENRDASLPVEDLERRELSLGTKIRIIRVPFFGQEGEVVELPSDPQRIDTGAFTRVLKARLGDGSVVVVPRANVELL